MEERRVAHRYRVPLPASIRLLQPSATPGELHATTRDVSTSGIYFTSDQPLAIGARFDLSLTFPAEITNGSAVVVDAQARVLRVDERQAEDSNRFGIAAAIDRLNVSRTAVDFALHKAEQAIEKRQAATSSR
jgi:hypothetical protein